MKAFSFWKNKISIEERNKKSVVIFREPDVLEVSLMFMNIISNNELMKVNKFVQMYDQAKKCYAYQNPFSTKNRKVINHNHVTVDVNGT